MRFKVNCAAAAAAASNVGVFFFQIGEGISVLHHLFVFIKWVLARVWKTWVKEELLEKKSLAASLPATPLFLQWNLRTMQILLWTQEEEEKFQMQSFWLQRCWKWVSTCSGSWLSKSGFVVRSFLLYIALVSHWFQQSVSLYNALFLASCLVSCSCQKRIIRMFFLSDSQSCLSFHAVFLHIMDAVVG